MNAVKDNCLYENELGILLSKCRDLLSSSFSYVLTFIHKQANRVTHDLTIASIHDVFNLKTCSSLTNKLSFIS